MVRAEQCRLVSDGDCSCDVYNNIPTISFGTVFYFKYPFSLYVVLSHHIWPGIQSIFAAFSFKKEFSAKKHVFSCSMTLVLLYAESIPI